MMEQQRTANAAIRIDGSGPVALACALLLLRQGFTPADIALTMPTGELPEQLARRAIATSHGSWLTLGRVAALPPTAVITHVEVRISGQDGLLKFNADELGVPVLGHIVRYGELAAALHQAATAAGLGNARCSPDTGPQVVIDAGGDPGEDISERDFGQSAVLVDLQVGNCADDCALEWFTTHGPIALLPQPEAGIFSLVWCGSAADTERRLQLDPGEFIRELRASMAGAAGDDAAPDASRARSFELAGQRHSAVLKRRARRRLVEGNAVAIGNAAQALHPVGAQGLNLGFRDAFEIARCLGDARAAGRPLASALGQYERARGLDRRAVITATDTLAVAFKWPILHPLQSFALEALGHLPRTRRAVVRAFMFGLR